MALPEAGTKDALKGKLAAKAGGDIAPKQDNTLGGFLERTKGEWSKALPQHVTADRLMRIAVSAVNRNPNLAKCTMQSLVAGVVISSQLGLELNTPLGHAYLIPYSRSVKVGNEWKKVDEAQFQLGYAGILDLAYRSGQFKGIYSESVYENDEFSYEYGYDKSLKHKPTEGEPGLLKGVYAVFHLKDGGSDFKYWSVAKIMAHAAKYSGAWDAAAGKFKAKSSWADSFEGMAKVPVLKDLLKLAPKSIEFQKQLTLDNSVKTEFKADMVEASGIEVEYSIVDQDTGELPMTAEEKKGEGAEPLFDAK